MFFSGDLMIFLWEYLRNQADNKDELEKPGSNAICLWLSPVSRQILRNPSVLKAVSLHSPDFGSVRT